MTRPLSVARYNKLVTRPLSVARYNKSVMTHLLSVARYNKLVTRPLSVARYNNSVLACSPPHTITDGTTPHIHTERERVRLYPNTLTDR